MNKGYKEPDELLTLIEEIKSDAEEQAKVLRIYASCKTSEQVAIASKVFQRYVKMKERSYIMGFFDTVAELTRLRHRFGLPLMELAPLGVPLKLREIKPKRRLTSTVFSPHGLCPVSPIDGLYHVPSNRP